MAEKIPEADRPPVATIERLLRVSADRRVRFIVDLQNDCACPMELYDADTSWQPFGCVYWDGRPRVLTHGCRLALPIQPGILTDEVVDELVAFAGLTPEVFERYDMLNYGVIAVNLAGWGLSCQAVRPV